ncbi:transposable element Tcb2 transposase [Trichonephila clavipes]|uniref:Transposable element Tcb2 transposase n=1 Tax=Trichonephila clavipes TaxID=2585209 RepID=A0A8X6RJ05_TRICX|nr:transposable element Tcb2 transposase [Trichonephila clavipes]
MDDASICGTMMTAFVLDALLVNAAFQSALSKDIVVYHPELWSLIEHVWDFVGRRLGRDPAASKDELLLHIQAIWNSLPQADIQNLFDSMPRRIAALIAAHIPNTDFGHLILF